ncbi:unnamed protein product, partial [Polarella glacialis]
VRYHTPAADLYRRRLQARSEGREIEPLPSELRRVPLPPPSRCSSGSSLSTSSRRPVWTPDAEAPRCQLCRRDFSFFVRRHHCRKCGRCICAECSPGESMRPLFDLGYEAPCRHCKVCSPPAARVISGLAAS